MRPTIRVKGHKELIRILEAFSKTTAKKIIRQATTAATRPLRKAVKENTPVDQGDLKRSIAMKVIAKGFTANGIVGSDTSIMDSDGKARAARHLHLVEHGFQHHDGQTVAGAHMLQKGFEQSQSTCLAIYEKKLAEGIEREMTK